MKPVLALRQAVLSSGTFQGPANNDYMTVFGRFGVLLDYARTSLAQFIDDAAEVESLIQEAETLFDAYIAPINLPWIPDRLVEPLVDANLRQSIRPTLMAMHEWAKKNKSPVPPQPKPLPHINPSIGSAPPAGSSQS